MTTNKSPVYIIAEAGVNHNGRRDFAFKLVDAAVEAGADAVKFQTFKAAKLAHKSLEKAQYQQQNTNAKESQYEMLTALEMPESWHHELQAHANAQGIDFLSTAFDEESLAFLQTMNLPRYKVSSGELINAPLLWRFAQSGKPLILSTGMATLAEVEKALAIVAHGLTFAQEPKNMDEVWMKWSQANVRAQLKDQVTLLHCTSQYPTPWHEVNLKAIDTLSQAFGLEVGYSDHTIGTMMSIAAVARGATVIEKHFTLDKLLPGPDHVASIEVAELKELVANIRDLEMALGDGIKVTQASEWNTRKVARQSIVAANSIKYGDIIKRSDLTTSRTGGGISPDLIWEITGTVCVKSYVQGEAISR